MKADRFGVVLFPIMDSSYLHAIPLAMIEPHEPQAQRNHSQTLKRLAERGGLCPSEAVDVLRGQRFNTTGQDGAEQYLCAMLAAFLLRQREAAHSGYSAKEGSNA